MKSLLRYTLPVLVLLCAAYLVLNAIAPGETIALEDSAFGKSLTLEQAVARSAESGRPVLVFATADWCGPCQHLKRTALADAEVNKAIRETTEPVYLDLTNARNDPEAVRLAQQMRIGGIPALIMQQDGRELSRIEGSTTARSLLAWLAANDPS